MKEDKRELKAAKRISAVLASYASNDNVIATIANQLQYEPQSLKHDILALWNYIKTKKEDIK